MLSSAAAILGAGFLNTAGSVYTNTLNAANASRINKDNVALQYAINADQIEAARMNNQTAIDLANTAHQREVRDLRDAGLNPILSTHGSGADSPSLQAPNLDAPTLQRYDQVNPLGGIASAVAGMVQADDQHKFSELQRKYLDSQLPDRPGLLKQQAAEEANAAISEARSAKSAADFEKAINDFRTSLISAAQWNYDNGHLSPKDMENLSINPSELFELIKEGTVSDLKLRANANWQKDLDSIMGAINSGVSAGASLRGMRRPVGRVTTLPNGKLITTKDLFK